jgi:GTP pyrophosphokinase
MPDGGKERGSYPAELSIYAENRTGLLVDVSRVFTERHIDIGQLNVRTSKQGSATMDISFLMHSTDELRDLVTQLKKIPDVIDITRKTG